jgi:origin recognition complex subunit 6
MSLAALPHPLKHHPQHPMSTTGISKALVTLLPSLQTYPPTLLSSCESLLALSRQRARHLKPEEEIARAHACAEIACERLRAPLRLPPTKKGGAPAKPVVYKKLLGFLEKVLEDAGTGTPRGTPKRKRDDGEGETPRNVRRRLDVEVETPTKSTGKRDGGFLGAIKAGSAKEKEAEGEAPEFVMPAIRKLCRVFKTPELAPHVYVGTCIVLKSENLWPQTDETSQEKFESNIISLVGGLYLMVLTRMQRGHMNKKVYFGVRDKTVETFDVLSNGQEIASWIRKTKESYCKGQDWYESIPKAVFDFSMQNMSGDVTTTAEEAPEDIVEVDLDGMEDSAFSRRKAIDPHEEDPEGVLLPGLGTMMSDIVNWLSDERKEAYQSWKAELLKQIAAVSAG